MKIPLLPENVGKRPRDQLSGHHKMRIELKYRLKMVKKESSLKDGHIKNLLKSTTKQIPKKVLKSWEMGTVIPPPPNGPHFPLFILMSENLSVNKTDLQALMGPTVTGPVQDPLAVLSLNNRLYM